MFGTDLEVTPEHGADVVDEQQRRFSVGVDPALSAPLSHLRLHSVALLGVDR